ncbi:MAG: glycosyltransferase [Cyanobacteria bacterium P01_C01_bin.120]
MNKTKTVSLFVPSLDGGGAEKVAINLAQALANIGHKVYLVIAQAEGAYLQQNFNDIELVDLQAKSPIFLYKTLALKQHLKEKQPDYLIAILDVLGSAIIARHLAKVSTKVVMVVQTNLSQQFQDRHGAAVTNFKWFCINRLYPHADAIATASKGVAKDLSSNTGLSHQDLKVLYNPILTHDFYEKVKEPIQHPWFATGEPPVILGVGRLVKQKDFATLVRAFAQVRQKQLARLVILGDVDKREPQIKPYLQSLIQEFGLEADVDLPGFVSNPYTYMAKARVFVLSSIYEGFGNVVAEALAAGTSVVSTDCESGPAEILDYGRYGRLAPVGNPEALAEKICATLAETPNSEHLQERAAMFSVNRVASQYVDFLSRL